MIISDVTQRALTSKVTSGKNNHNLKTDGSITEQAPTDIVYRGTA